MLQHRDTVPGLGDGVVQPVPCSWSPNGRRRTACVSCNYAMRIKGSSLIRCDRHDVRMGREESCMDYVPAPELKEARKIWKMGSAA